MSNAHSYTKSHKNLCTSSPVLKYLNNNSITLPYHTKSSNDDDNVISTTYDDVHK